MRVSVSTLVQAITRPDDPNAAVVLYLAVEGPKGPVGQFSVECASADAADVKAGERMVLTLETAPPPEAPKVVADEPAEPA